VTQIAADVHRAAACGPEDVLVTDAGSTKRRIVEVVESNPRSRSVFVGGHPLAGSERQGVAHAQEELFEGRVCVLTPTAATPPDRLQRARGFWRALGCRVVELDPVAHDEALALTSHLPHVLAAALAAAVPGDALRLAAGAFRDGTRVAASDAALWTAIFLENRAPCSGRWTISKVSSAGSVRRSKPLMKPRSAPGGMSRGPGAASSSKAMPLGGSTTRQLKPDEACAEVGRVNRTRTSPSRLTAHHAMASSD
jgi:hypothetical protein